MAELVWTENARDNLREIAEYLAEEAPPHAEPQIRRLHEAAGRLEDFPQSGRPVPELDGDLREILVDNYRIIYRVSPPNVSIVAVVHGRQDFREIWEADESSS